MKKIATLFLSLTLVFMMAGCTSDYMEDRLTTLEEQVTTLEEENTTLKETNQELLDTNAALNAAKLALEDAKSALENDKVTLTTSKTALEGQIAQLQTDLENAKSDNQTELESQIATLQTELTEIEKDLAASYDGAFALKLGSDITIFSFKNSDEKSLFDIIDSSEIALEYTDSSYGHMITLIGNQEADLFHWISLLKNGESAMVGVDELTFVDGDIIEFKEKTITWETTFNAEFKGDGGFDNLQFLSETGQTFYIDEINLPSEMTIESFIEGSDYKITGLSEVGSKGYGCSNCVIPSAIEATYIKDFTELYTLEAGTEIMLQFTVTELSAGWVWGNEVKASDSNGLLSKDVTANLQNPFSTGYLFYTFPSNIELEVGKTYVAKLTFDLFPPNSKAQLGFAGTDIDGNIDYNTVEIYELDSSGNIVKSAVKSSDTPSEMKVCTGFNDIKDNMTTGDQCEVTFTVTSISYGTPMATDILGVPSTDILGYFFDASWDSAEVDKTYTVIVEKQANGQIKLIGDLIETTSNTSFLDIRDNLVAGDQCQIIFTVTSVSWGTPQATDSFGNSSTDVLAYFFDASWGAAENSKTYTATVEKQANGQIGLIGELTEVTNE